MSANALQDYYSRRAREYEKIYERPERQKDLASLTDDLRKRLNGRYILEVACGTGYWSEPLAEDAAALTGIDQSAEVLDIAEGKGIAGARFVQGDAFALDPPPGYYNAGFAAFWWSHIPQKRIREFLTGLHSKLEPASHVIFVDNIFVEGSSTPIARTDANGDSYQARRLENGETYDIIKNFPSDDELRNAVAGLARDVEIKRFEYYWLLQYRIA